MTSHVLVTGGAGFIGSHLAHALVLRGYRVTVLDKIGAQDLSALDPTIQIVDADLTKPETIRLVKMLAPDVIFHFAGNASVARSVADPLFDFQINYRATAELLQAATEMGVKQFIFSSTGGGLSSEYTVLPTPEHLTGKPLSPYAIHKLASEQLGEFYRVDKGLPFIALRFANVYGPRQTPTRGEANVIATFAEKMANGLPTSINGTGRQTRDYVYIDDVIEACLLVLDRPEISGPLNVGSGVETDVLTIHRLLSGYFGLTEKPEHRPAESGAPMRSCLDISKIQNVLGWKPKTRFAQGLAATADWHRERVKEKVRDKMVKIAV